jgi:hypothetical protein
MAVRKRFWTLLARREGRFLPEFGSFVRGESLPPRGRIDAARAGRAPYNQPLQSRIANTTIVVIEFRKWSGQSSGIVGGSRRAADSS